MIRLIIIKLTRIAILCVVLISSASCTKRSGPSSWPVVGVEAYDNFSANFDALQELREMMEVSEYTSLIRTGSDEASGLLERDGLREWEVPTESALWAELMSSAKLDNIIRIENIYTFIESVSSADGTNFQGIMYIHADTQPLKMCADKFQDVRCGMCDVYRESDWTIRYMWVSGDHVSRYLESTDIDSLDSENGMQTHLERFRGLDESNQECLRAGFSEMGYEDPAKFFD